MEPKILISACLLGQPVRYNGKGLHLESTIVQRWQQQDRLVALCPEVAAGFPTPRPPAEIEPGKSANEVLIGTGKIFENSGADVSEGFRAGAMIAVDTASAHNCKFALLTDGSPSCGSSFIYSGTHNGEKRSGSGVVAAALSDAGVEIFAQHQIKMLAERLAQHTSETG
ncbi:MAG: DUF523 domain-containing protein [Devosiaceae bacterium]